MEHKQVVISSNYQDVHAPVYKRNVLMLTSTISPPVNATCRSDPNVRLNDYLNSLEFYLSLASELYNRIIFVENSYANIQQIVDLVRNLEHDKTVEIISFSGNDHPVEYGKAYGEFKLIDYGLDHSTLITDKDLIWKITGRLKALNLGDLIRSSNKKCDVICDLHNIPFVGSLKWSHRKNMDLRMFAININAFQQIFQKKWLLMNHIFDECCAYKLIREARQSFQIQPRFHVQPLISGISGRHQRAYDSPLQSTKSCFRGIMRKIAPWIWI